jgi:hypothetical protein
LLGCRIVTASLREKKITIKTTRSCPKRWLLSPLLWSFAIDKLLTELDERGSEVIGLADDQVTIVKSRIDSILSERLNSLAVAKKVTLTVLCTIFGHFIFVITF